MGVRFRRSIKVAPGVKINLNKKSASVSIGGKGYHKTFNSNGQTTTSVNLPVKGLSYVERTNDNSRKNNYSKDKYVPNNELASDTIYHDSLRTKDSGKKEKPPKCQTMLLDKPNVFFVIIGILILMFAIYLYMSSALCGVIAGLIGLYLIYSYIDFKHDPTNPKYITDEQLERWGNLVSSDKRTVIELKKVSIPILLDLKERTQNYNNQLSRSINSDEIHKCSELLLATQQKIIDLSEFVIIAGDEPQMDYEKYLALVNEVC